MEKQIFLFIPILLLASFAFASEDVRWIEHAVAQQSLNDVQMHAYHSPLNNTNIDYAYVYYDDYLYLEIFTPKTINSKLTELIQISLNKDINLSFNKNGTIIQSNNKSDSNQSLVFYSSDTTNPQWSARTMILLKDLEVDKNCDATVDMNINVFDEQKNVLSSAITQLSSSSCWATPKKVIVSKHGDTPQNQTDSPASLSRQYLSLVLNVTPPGYPNDTEGAKIDSITLKLITNSNTDGAQVLAFVGPDGISLGSENFDENGLLTLHPTDAYISDEPRTIAIELLMSPNAQFLYDNDSIIPAYYGVELYELNLSGKYTKTPLRVDFENAPIRSEYVAMMECTRDAECPTNNICTEQNTCIERTKIVTPKINDTKNTSETVEKPDTKPIEIYQPKQTETELPYLVYFVVAIIIAIIAIFCYTKKSKNQSAQTEDKKD